MRDINLLNSILNLSFNYFLKYSEKKNFMKILEDDDELSNNDSKQNSLLANPELDLDDRGLSDNKLLHLTNTENEDMYSEITMLFHETVVSLEENFNEEHGDNID